MQRPAESYWELMAEAAALQAEMAEDLIAWSRAYEAGGEALRRTARTAGRMAEVGRRMEQYLESGPPATVRQALELFARPWGGLGGAPGAGLADPFAGLWEQWRSAFPGGEGKAAGGSRGEE